MKIMPIKIMHYYNIMGSLNTYVCVSGDKRNASFSKKIFVRTKLMIPITIFTNNSCFSHKCFLKSNVAGKLP